MNENRQSLYISWAGQMDRHRWETVNRIFHAALELDSDSIENFVRLASEGDTEIYAEVMALLRADEKAGSYLETPLRQENLSALFESPLKPEDVLCERFQILRAIAEGGMGHVFEALDTELNVRVALKVIRPEIASVPEALARFRQEVRLARTITHPNVCRTFDIDRETRVLEPETGSKLDLVFLTMELLAGETLASRIKRDGALPIAEAFLLACQIGDALHAAHALGIVHRDIKPSNIMLVPTESATVDNKVRAVITDFGLARLNPVLPIGTASSLSHTARPIGTLAYMAPEQLDGAPVSPATDIYAFGLILFEMVTGSRAFPSENLLTGLSQRLTGPPPSPKSIAPRLPDNWCYVIDRCLQVNPSERLQEASEVATALAGNRRHRISGQRHFFLSLTFLFSLFRRTFAAVATTICICVALFAVGFRLYQSRADSSVTPGALVYLAPVKNETGQTSLDNITELIRAGLAQSVQVNLLDQGRVGDILQQMTKSPDGPIDQVTGREIAMRARAARVVFTTVSQSGSNYTLNVDIQQPDNTPSRYRERWEKSYAWHMSGAPDASVTIPLELLTAVRKSSDWIRSNAGESAENIGFLSVPPQNVTTADWQALMDYDQANRRLQNGQKEEAITLLQHAVRRDPGFALAYADLADNLVSIGRISEGYQAYLSALNSDSGQRLTRKERDFIKGTFATDTRDYQAALEAFRDYSAFYEKDFYGWFYQAYPLEQLDRPKDALQVLERADSLSLTHRASGQMAYEYMLLGDYAAARQSIGRARTAGHIDQATFLEGVESLCEGDSSRAYQYFSYSQQANNHDFLSLSYLEHTRVLAEQGRYSEALADIDHGSNALTGVAGAEYKALQSLDRGYLEFHLGSPSQGLVSISQALDSSTAADTILLASTIVGGALPHLRPQDRDRAKALLLRMDRASPKETLGIVDALARVRVRGELMLAEGDARGALQAFRTADKLDAPLAPREYLARGLLAVALTVSKPDEALELRNEALNAYAKVALRPATVWVDGWTLPAGFVADQMTEYLKLAAALHRSGTYVQEVSTTLSSLRPNSTVPVTTPPPGWPQAR